MIFAVIMALIIMMYVFGLKAVYLGGGLFVLFYAYAIISARRPPGKKDQKND